MSFSGPADGERRAESRRLRWESWTEWPLMAAALLFLVVYAWPILDPTLDTSLSRALTGVGLAVWAMTTVTTVGMEMPTPSPALAG